MEYPESTIRLRQLMKEDISFAMELKNIAKWNQTADCWNGYISFEPEGCFLAEWNGEKAGTSTAISYESRFGWIGMVLVHPNMRRHRIGTTLLKHAIQYIQDQGTPCVKLDATEIGRPLYVQLGFRDEYEVHRYEGMTVSPYDRGIAPETARTVELLTPDKIDAILSFDGESFGAERENILSAMLARNPEYCFYIPEDEGISGYIMAHEGSGALQLGPWVAKNATAAESLFIRLLEQTPNRLLFLDVPLPNQQATALMNKYGFRKQRGFYRMFLGENRYPGIPQRIYGTSGAETG